MPKPESHMGILSSPYSVGLHTHSIFSGVLKSGLLFFSSGSTAGGKLSRSKYHGRTSPGSVTGMTGSSVVFFSGLRAPSTFAGDC